MNIVELTLDIQKTATDFHELNREHWRRGTGNYRALDNSSERRLVRLAGRIERLYRFRAYLLAKEYAG